MRSMTIRNEDGWTEKAYFDGRCVIEVSSAQTVIRMDRSCASQLLAWLTQALLDEENLTFRLTLKQEKLDGQSAGSD